MDAKLEINVAEAIEAYYNLVEYNTMNGFRGTHPSCVFVEKLRDFLNEMGVELN